MELTGLIGNLKTHEMERKAKKETAPQKKKMIAFKSTPTIFEKMMKTMKKKMMKTSPSL